MEPEKKFNKVIVLGADYHGEWAKDVCIAFKDIGMDAELIYTNTVFGAMGSTRMAAKTLLEKVKQFFRLHARFIFDLVKEIRRRMSERALVEKIASFQKPGEKILILFIWTPPSASLLAALKKNSAITLILWQGEAPARNAIWGPSFPFFDHIFSVDEDWLHLFDEALWGRITYLPLSSSPANHFPLPKEKQDPQFASEVAFVGYYRSERAEKLAVLKEYDLRIYGFWWESGMSRFPWLKEKYFGPASNEDANKVFNGGKIQIGRLSATPIAHGDTVTQRVFDISLAGSFQLSEYSPAIEKIFGQSVVMFNTTEELKKLVAYYLAHPEERERLAARAHAIALKDHTYASRIKAIMEVVMKLQ